MSDPELNDDPDAEPLHINTLYSWNYTGLCSHCSEGRETSANPALHETAGQLCESCARHFGFDIEHDYFRHRMPTDEELNDQVRRAERIVIIGHLPNPSFASQTEVWQASYSDACDLCHRYTNLFRSSHFDRFACAPCVVELGGIPITRPTHESRGRAPIYPASISPPRSHGV